MADQSEKQLAAVFDLLKISLGKTDPTLDKSNALKGLVVVAVARAEAAEKRQPQSDCNRCVHHSALFDWRVVNIR